MYLNELVKKCKELSSNYNPEIKIISNSGFEDIVDVTNRSDYHDESFFGKKLPQGDFIVLESGDNQEIE